MKPSNDLRRPEIVLTAREHHVLECIAAGMTNAEVAAALHLSTSTVKTHLSSLYAKLGVENRTQAAVSQLARSTSEREHRRLGSAADGVFRLSAVDARTGAEVELRFSGEEVLEGWVYRTTEGRAIILDEDDRYRVFEARDIAADGDRFADLVHEILDRDVDPESVGLVLKAFDVTPIVEL